MSMGVRFVYSHARFGLLEETGVVLGKLWQDSSNNDICMIAKKAPETLPIGEYSCGLNVRWGDVLKNACEIFT